MPDDFQKPTDAIMRVSAPCPCAQLAKASVRAEAGRVDTVRSVTAESELAGFIAKFAPEMQWRIRGCRAKLEARFPDAVQLVYDNYNFLVIGFGPTRRASDAILSLAAHARGVNLCFLQRGPELPDPTSILRGSGKVVRTVALHPPTISIGPTSAL